MTALRLQAFKSRLPRRLKYTLHRLTTRTTQMSYDTNNIFAKILRDEAPAFKVYEDEFSLAFMDVMPQVEGHTLVIPKDDAADLHSVDADILGHTMQTVQTVLCGGETGLCSPWRHDSAA